MEWLDNNPTKEGCGMMGSAKVSSGIAKRRFAFGILEGVLGVTSVMAVFLAACSGGFGGNNGGDTDVGVEEEKVYTAELKPMNESVGGTSARGNVTITLKGDTMIIQVAASGLHPNMMHLMHYHGFPGGQEARCATDEEDVNKDGIIDLIETREVSGITLVPFNGNPAELEITSQTYPVASTQGAVAYSDTVMISKLVDALRSKHGINSLQLKNRVVYLHGVAAETGLPMTVESLPGIPAHITLPIACGKLEEKNGGGFFPF